MSNVDTSVLLDQVREIMASTFALDESDLPDDVSQQTCRRWTSLQHMTLMVALEEGMELIGVAIFANALLHLCLAACPKLRTVVE